MHLSKCFASTGRCCSITSRRFFSNSTSIKQWNIKGRDVISPLDLTSNEVKYILWTAFDIKTQKRTNHLLDSRHITFINAVSSVRNQVSFERAVQALGGNFSIIHGNNLGPSSQSSDLTDCGRMFSSLTDMIVINGLEQKKTISLADGASIPVFATRTDLFAISTVLADLMTLIEVVGPLRRKCLAWIGPVTPSIETYLCLGPKLGLSVRLHCFCPDGSGNMSPAVLLKAHSLKNSEIHDCMSAEEAVYRADIVATSCHSDSRNKITLKILEEAALDWFFLHSLPRSDIEVSDDVFKHKSNLTWQSVTNTKYIYMALLERLLTDHPLTSSIPDFDGPP